MRYIAVEFSPLGLSRNETAPASAERKSLSPIEVEAAVEEVLDSGAVERRVSGAVEVDPLVALEIGARRRWPPNPARRRCPPTFPAGRARGAGVSWPMAVFIVRSAWTPKRPLSGDGGWPCQREREEDVDGGRPGGAPILERTCAPVKERHREVTVELAIWSSPISSDCAPAPRPWGSRRSRASGRGPASRRRTRAGSRAAARRTAAPSGAASGGDGTLPNQERRSSPGAG